MATIQSSFPFLQLPPEIRDMVYSYYFARKYLVYRVNPYNKRNLVNSQNREGLALLRTSKSIASDARHVLFSRGASKATTFRYEITFGFGRRKSSTPPTKEATDHMRNVEFSFELYLDPVAGMRSTARRGYEYLLCEPTVNHFTGTSIARDHCQISVQFLDEGFDDVLIEFVDTLFPTLKKSVGFRRLTFVVIISSPSNESALEQCFKKAQTELLPHLGPCVIKKPAAKIDWESNDVPSFELEFHPLEFHVEGLRAEASRLTKEADRLEE